MLISASKLAYLHMRSPGRTKRQTCKVCLNLRNKQSPYAFNRNFYQSPCSKSPCIHQNPYPSFRRSRTSHSGRSPDFDQRCLSLPGYHQWQMKGNSLTQWRLRSGLAPDSLFTCWRRNYGSFFKKNSFYRGFHTAGTWMLWILFSYTPVIIENRSFKVKSCKRPWQRHCCHFASILL